MRPAPALLNSRGLEHNSTYLDSSAALWGASPYSPPLPPTDLSEVTGDALFTGFMEPFLRLAYLSVKASCTFLIFSPPPFLSPHLLLHLFKNTPVASQKEEVQKKRLMEPQREVSSNNFSSSLCETHIYTTHKGRGTEKKKYDLSLWKGERQWSVIFTSGK